MKNFRVARNNQESPAARTSKPSWGNHPLGMDGLRGIAALTVPIGHVGGGLAVGVQRPGVLTVLVAVSGQGLTLFYAPPGPSSETKSAQQSFKPS
jgi:peptidoglycan/LPS O-acetylase OafA/YrhL